jgi:hypothetical protein
MISLISLGDHLDHVPFRTLATDLLFHEVSKRKRVSDIGQSFSIINKLSFQIFHREYINRPVFFV